MLEIISNSVALLCEKWSRGAWQFLSTICRDGDCIMLWPQSFQTETPEPVKYVSVISTWCYAWLLPKLMILTEYLLIKTTVLRPLLITFTLKGSYGYNTFLAWKRLFLPFQIHQQKHMKCHFCPAVDLNFHNKRK